MEKDLSLIESYISNYYLDKKQEDESKITLIQVASGLVEDMRKKNKKKVIFKGMKYVQIMYERIKILAPLVTLCGYLGIKSLSDVLDTYMACIIDMCSLEDVAEFSGLEEFDRLQLESLSEWIKDNPELADPGANIDYVGTGHFDS